MGQAARRELALGLRSAEPGRDTGPWQAAVGRGLGSRDSTTSESECLGALNLLCDVLVFIHESAA